MALTPNIRTVARFGIPGKDRTVRGYYLRKDAKDIGKGRLPGAPKQTGVQLIGGGDAYLLTERYQERAQLAKSANESDVLGSGGGLINLAPGVEARNTFRRDDDLTGTDTSGSVIAAGVTGFRKRVSTDWDTAVLDLGGIPQPDADGDTEQTVPVDRILEGTESYPENCPFLLMLRLPPVKDLGYDILANYYFGGAASVTPEAAEGGRFCLTLRGGGTAILWEWVTPPEPEEEEEPANPWQERFRFTLQGEGAGDAGSLLSVRITPYGRDRIAFDGRSFSLDGSPFGGLGAILSIAGIGANFMKQPKSATLYLDREKATGHVHTRTITGAGNVRLDHRRKPRADVTLVRGRYVTTGTIVDGPFVLPVGTPTGTPLRLDVEAYVIPNGVVSYDLRDATTHEPLETDDDGRFLTNAGQRYYYPTITLTSPDGVQSPVLWRYTVASDPIFTERTGEPVTSPTWGTQVTGPDLEPDHETASFAIKDRYANLTLLRVQDRIRTTVSLADATTGVILSHLMDGETLQVHAKHRGNAAHLPGWYDYDVRLVGLWAKLRRQFYAGNLRSAFQDPDADVNPETLEREEVCYKVSDWLREVLIEAGAPEDELDIPDSPLRFWSADSPDDIALQYGADLLALASKLCKDYLGRIFVRDPNAGAHDRGMWRTLLNPTAPYTNRLFTLYRERPVGAPNMVHATRAHAFGQNTALVLEDTWETWLEGPEATHITVEGNTSSGPDGDGRYETSVFLPGWDNPASPNFSPEIIPFTHGPDPSLTTQAAVDWQARVIIERVGARKWWKARCALLLLRDPLDPLQNADLLRPPRVNDQCTLVTDAGTFTGLVRSCDPLKPVGSDGFWQMDLTGVIVG